jgi:hypothetical protein
MHGHGNGTKLYELISFGRTSPYGRRFVTIFEKGFAGCAKLTDLQEKIVTKVPTNKFPDTDTVTVTQ